MNRRNPNAISGYVNFPTNKESTSEGGMFVQLIVVPIETSEENEFMKCCGGLTGISYGESLVYADSPEYRKLQEEFIKVSTRTFTDEEYKNGEFIKSMDREQEIMREQDSLFFPRLHDRTSDIYDRYSSVGLLAAFTIGSTGWSGEFGCTYDDLTESGKAMYNQIAELYKGSGQLILLTWLDT